MCVIRFKKKHKKLNFTKDKPPLGTQIHSYGNVAEIFKKNKIDNKVKACNIK
jgi:hypothetical protein